LELEKKRQEESRKKQRGPRKERPGHFLVVEGSFFS